MSFLIFKKTRTAANVIQALKNTSNADIDSLDLHGVLSETVPWCSTFSLIRLPLAILCCNSIYAIAIVYWF
jgi:hypothetical protein